MAQRSLKFFSSLMALLYLSFLATTLAHSATTLQYYKRGVAYYKRERYVPAIRIWRAILRHRKNEMSRVQKVRTCLGLAKAYAKLGKNEHALKLVNYAQRLAPKSSVIYRTKKKIRARKNKSGRKEQLSLSEALQSIDTGLMMEKASSGQGKKYFMEALPSFKSALKKGHNLPFAHYGIGVCLLHSSSELDKAKQHIEKALKLRPDDPRFNLQMAKVCERQGDLSGEIKHLEACIDGGRGSPAIHSSLAIAYGKRDDPQDRDRLLEVARTAIDYDSSYGVAIVQATKDERLQEKLGKMMAKAKYAQLGSQDKEKIKQIAKRVKKDPSLAKKLKDSKYGKQIAERLKKDPSLINKLKKRFGNRIPAKYRQQVQKYLGN